MTGFTESVVEEAALAWLEGLGYSILHGPMIAAGETAAERSDPNYRDVVLEQRLRQSLVRLNPDLPHEALDEAFRKLMRADAPSLIARNWAVHRMFVDGVTVEYTRPDGSIVGAQARVLDFDEPANNDWLAVNQFTVAEGRNMRRTRVVQTLAHNHGAGRRKPGTGRASSGPRGSVRPAPLPRPGKALHRV
jgi:type I restriction enzyme R subunit